MKNFLTNDEVAERAQRWVMLWRNPKYRDKMDDVLKGLSEVDQRRVRLCGQRMSGGLSLKVIPAPQQGKEGKNGETKKGKAESKQRGQRADAAANSAGKAKGKASVGANHGAAKSGHRRSRKSGA